MLCKFWRKI